MILFKFFILGTITALMFPPFFMLPLGFVIFPYIIKLINKIFYKKSLFFFNYGFSFGLGFFLIFLCWIYNPFLVFQNTQPFAFLSILLPIFLSIFFGLSFLLYIYVKNSYLIIIFTVFIFSFAEFLISNFLYGFPWFSYSLILSNNLLGFYIVKYFGTYASGVVILLIFILPTILFNFKNKIKINILIKITLIPFVIVIFLLIKDIFFTKNNFTKVLTLDVHQIFSPIENINRKKIEEDISQIINQSDSDYIIFAENNYPYIFSEAKYLDFTKYIKNKKKVIIGATRKDNGKFYNSFLLLEENKTQFFDKSFLVPFGEFLPFRRFLKFMEKISGTYDFETGNIDRILITKDNVKILPIICYEIIFDQIYKDINKNKIDILINITNDAWFGNKVGPFQHFYLTRLKSLVANKPIVRVSNNGISAIFNQDGKIIKFSKLNQKTNIKHKLNIKNTKSYYLIHKFFSFYIIFLFLFFLIFGKYILNEKK